MRAESTLVEVRSSYVDGHWAAGFEIAEVIRRRDQDLYRIRRRSDGVVLPALFNRDDVRPLRRNELA